MTKAEKMAMKTVHDLGVAGDWDVCNYTGLSPVSAGWALDSLYRKEYLKMVSTKCECDTNEHGEVINVKAFTLFELTPEGREAAKKIPDIDEPMCIPITKLILKGGATMRLIDADRAMEIVRYQGIAHPNAYHLTNYAMLILREAPTVDAVPAANIAPVRHGRWIEHEKYDFGTMYDCSICGDRILDNGHSWNYCPNCGADMRGSNDEKVREDKHDAL